MKAICINEYVGETYMALTLGKVYDVVKKGKSPMTKEESLFIINEAGYGSWYTRRVVIPLEEWRENKLKELGI
jgi:hypothetical protein